MSTLINSLKHALTQGATAPKQVCNYPNNYYGDQCCK